MNENEGKPTTTTSAADLLALGLFGITCLIALYCLAVIVAPIEDVFKSLGIQMPLPTMFYCVLWHLVGNFWYVVLPFLGLLSLYPLFAARRTAAGRKMPLGTQKVWLTYLVATVVILVFSFGGFASVVGPVAKIQQMINKR